MQRISWHCGRVWAMVVAVRGGGGGQIVHRCIVVIIAGFTHAVRSAHAEGGGGTVCEGEQESEARISYAQASMMYEHEHENNSSEKSKESTQSDSVLNEYYGKDRRKGQRLTPDTHWRVARQQGSAAFRCGGKARPWSPGKKKPAPPLRRLGCSGGHPVTRFLLG